MLMSDLGDSRRIKMTNGGSTKDKVTVENLLETKRNLKACEGYLNLGDQDRKSFRKRMSVVEFEGKGDSKETTSGKYACGRGSTRVAISGQL